MNSTTAQTYPLKSEPNTRAAIRFIVTGSIAIAATLLFFWLRGRHEGMVRYWDPERAAPVFAFSLAMAVAFAWVRYRDTAAIFLSLTRITAAGVLVYLIVEPPSFTNANDRASLIQFVNDGYWVALAAAALSLWRPSFLFPAALYAISTRYIASAISGFEISTLDIRYMMEMAQFLSCCACGLVVLRWISGRSIGRQPLELIDQNSLAMSLAFVAIGFHLGNYFWSGYEKLLLGPHPWSWVLVNETQNIMAGALKKGVLPTGAFPTITQWLYAGLGFFVIPMNFAVLAVQLFAIVAALRIRWLIVASLAYDAFHVGIYIFGGLFFWPWIWNNASIIICLRNRTDAEIGWLPKLCCIATVISGFSLHLAASARLAWFDVLDFKTPTIQARALNGDWVNVPSSFFMSHSYAVSHGYFDLVRTHGHYPPSIWGSVTDHERALSSGHCPPAASVQDAETPEARADRLDKLGRLIRAHHTRMVAMKDRYGQHVFDFRSHHHPSNPWLYSAFYNLDLNLVQAYRVVTQSVCLKLEAGSLRETEVARSELTFHVR